jgi:prepilin-type N-terminal cleavage/methylation domain-containing protein
MSLRLEGRRSRRAFTLMEVMISVMLLSIGLLAVTGLSAKSVRTASRASEEGRYWGDAQEVIDSVMALGFGVPSSGSTTMRGRAISWTVGSAATAPQLVTFAIQRTGYINKTAFVNDTIIVYLAKRNPGP